MSLDSLIVDGRAVRIEPESTGSFVVRDVETGIVRGEFELVETEDAQLSYWAGDDLSLVHRVATAYAAARAR